MARRRRNNLVLWEWSSNDQRKADARRTSHNPRLEVPEAMKSLSLIAGGLGCLYFAWLFSTTGIFVAGRSHVAMTAADNPTRFSFGVIVTTLVGVVSLLAGVVTLVRR
jgi:hypothetical protein